MTDLARRAKRSAPGLTVVGSVNLDLVARCERLPRPGETLTDATLRAARRRQGREPGRRGGAAGRAGAVRRAVGEDDFADDALAGLREAGVATELQRGAETGVALILVDDGGENVIVVAPGANAELREPQAEGAVLCQLEIPRRRGRGRRGRRGSTSS